MTTEQTSDIVNDALALLVGQVEQVPQSLWAGPSGLEGWTVAELVGHVTGSTTKILHQVRGDEIWANPSAPEGFVTSNPAGGLRSLAGQISHALVTAHLDASRPSPGGQATLREALRFPVSDVIIHAWDVANACGQELELPTHLRSYIEELVNSLPPQQLRSPGAFGPAVRPAAGASPTAALMAFLGRSVKTP